MDEYQGKVQCTDCETWIDVETGSETVQCDCGQRFVVTITSLPAPLA